MNRKLTRVAGLLLVSAVATMARFGYADKIELPARAVTADSQIVVRIDATAISADDLEKSKAAIVAMMGDLAKDAGPSKDDWQQMLDSRKSLTDTGVQQMVVIVGDLMQGPPKPIVTLKLKTGSDPAAVEKALKDIDAANAKKAGTPPTMDKISVKTLDGDWVYIEGENLTTPPAAGDAAGLKTFTDALGKQEGAPIRLGIHLSDNTKVMLATQAAAPPEANLPPFMKNIFTGLQTLDTASAGLIPGDNVKFNLSGTCTSADGAASLKKGTDGLVAVLSVAGLAGNQPPAQAVTMKIMTTILTLKQDGAGLSNSVDSNTLKDALKDLTTAPKPAPGQ